MSVEVAFLLKFKKCIWQHNTFLAQYGKKYYGQIFFQMHLIICIQKIVVYNVMFFITNATKSSSVAHIA